MSYPPAFRRPIVLAAALALCASLAAQKKRPTGYSDTPYLPGGKWRVHDGSRPRPPIVTPGTFSSQAKPGKPPSDAIVLFDGTDLSRWEGVNRDGSAKAAGWGLGEGYFESVSDGSLRTKESFGDIQLHVEWAAPAKIVSSSQGRGNSGILIMGLYEVQVLDSYNNVTYADGQAGAVYGQYPPLVNASRPPGEWQVYDIVFEAPRFEGEKLVKPAYYTVFHNGVLLHNRQEALGPMVHRKVAQYGPHPAEAPLALQDHSNPVRYRNIWVRRLDKLQQ